MSLNDALTVTGLGIGVVFIGLILTNGMIFCFSLFSRLGQWFKERKEKTPAEKTAAAFPVETAAGPAPPVNPDIIAVITTVLEVEFRLRASLHAGKLTIK